MEAELKATIKTVASLANVSPMTVSRVVNNGTAVKEETRQKVMLAIKKLNYHRNIFASNLPSRAKVRALGLVIKDFNFDYLLTVSYFNEILHGIQETVASKNYDLVIYNVNPYDRNDVNVGKWYHAGMVQGFLILSPDKEDTIIDRLIKENILFVILGANHDYRDVSYIDVENEKGVYTATKHLITLGHERIAIIKGPSGRADAFERESGYRMALQDNNIPLHKELVMEGNYDEKSGFEAAVKLLSNKIRPTAIFACNDLMAMGAVKAIQQNGLSVPGDISIIGFDDIPASSKFSPQLTTIRQPLKEMGKLGAEFLINDYKDAGALKKRLPVLLMVRESAAQAVSN
ncbi:MAG: LacI family DNA-binding transcriptional regulator [Elusimicrobiota bacterium]